jgi:NADH-quinone oxidoreductase subunit A
MLNIYITTCFAYEYDYMGLFFLIIISTALVFVLFILSFILSPKEVSAEKLSAYECGFEPFDEARKTFDVHFYIVAILFIIFDLEVAFLFPWAVSLNKIGIFGF